MQTLKDMNAVDHAREMVGFFENKKWCEEFLANNPSCRECAYELPCNKVAQVCAAIMEISFGVRSGEEASILIVRIVRAKSLQEIKEIISSAPKANWPISDFPDDWGDDF